jgi:hypothetical protein
MRIGEHELETLFAGCPAKDLLNGSAAIAAPRLWKKSMNRLFTASIMVDDGRMNDSVLSHDAPALVRAA